MKGFWMTVSFSTVKVFKITSKAALVLVFAAIPFSYLSTAKAADSDAKSVFNVDVKCPDGQVRTGWEKDSNPPNPICAPDCNALYKPVKEAEDKMTKACSDAGLGSGVACRTEIVKCIDPLIEKSSSDPNLLQSTMPLLGQAFGGNSALSGLGTAGASTPPSTPKSPKGCGNIGSRDFFDQKEKIDRDIKQAKTESADINDKITESQTTLNEKMEKAQENVNKALKNLEEKKGEVATKKREAAQELVAKQNEAANRVRALSVQVLAKRSEIADKDADFAASTLELSDNAMKLQCMVKVRELREALSSKGVFNSQSQMDGNFAQSDTLKQTFNSCLDQFHAKLRNLQQKRTNDMQRLGTEASNLQAELDDANISLTSYGQQMQETAKEFDAQVTAETKNTSNEMTAAQQALTLAQTNMQTKTADLRKKQLQINTRISELGDDLQNLGPVPKPGAKIGWQEAEGAVTTYMNEASSFSQSQCCVGNQKSSFGVCKMKPSEKADYDKKVQEQSDKSERNRKKNQRNSESNDNSNPINKILNSF